MSRRDPTTLLIDALLAPGSLSTRPEVTLMLAVWAGRRIKDRVKEQRTSVFRFYPPDDVIQCADRAVETFHSTLSGLTWPDSTIGVLAVTADQVRLRLIDVAELLQQLHAQRIHAQPTSSSGPISKRETATVEKKQTRTQPAASSSSPDDLGSRSTGSPERHASEHSLERWKVRHRVVDELPPSERIPWLLAHYLDLSRGVYARLGGSPIAFDKAVSNALKAIGDRLKRYDSNLKTLGSAGG